MGLIYFVGIGGIGMSAIAEILHDLGYKVSGSDQSDGANVARLRAKGIAVHVGHQEDNIHDIDTLVISTAIKPDNPEYRRARELNIPIAHRADMLATLMRLKKSIAIGGTHGKTTTTSLIAHMLITAGLDPSVISGGILNNYQSNAKLGQGEWLVAEADESDGSFLLLPAAVKVVTNIDAEHLDHYGNFDKVKESFLQFMRAVPIDGFVVACRDHPLVSTLIDSIDDRRVISYGVNESSPNSMVAAQHITFNQAGAHFDIAYHQAGERRVEKNITLPMLGIHNVSNATAAIAVGLEMGIRWEAIRLALQTFQGVKRRFSLVGVANGQRARNIRVIDDYAHHPTEITAVLAAAKTAVASKGRLMVIMQPHRYTRLRDLFDDFCQSLQPCHSLWVADVYAAGEAAISGIDADHFIAAIKQQGHPRVDKVIAADQLAAQLAPALKTDDMVLCLGAGDISKWAGRLAQELEPRL